MPAENNGNFHEPASCQRQDDTAVAKAIDDLASAGIRNHRPQSRVTSNPLPAVRTDLYARQRLRHSNLV